MYDSDTRARLVLCDGCAPDVDRDERTVAWVEADGTRVRVLMHPDYGRTGIPAYHLVGGEDDATEDLGEALVWALDACVIDTDTNPKQER